jgi:hypothetical protein
MQRALANDWRTIDWVIVLGFFLVALKFQLSLLYDAEFTVIPNSDSGAVMAFLSGWLHEERFIGDMILGDKSKFVFYLTLVMPAAAFLELFIGDLGRAFLWLMLPITFAQTAGFYLVGRRILEGRAAAAIFAVAALTPVWTMQGDLWGTHHTPLVRMAYSAFFPYLILLALNVRGHLGRLYVLAACCGATLYVHGVSGPSVTCALFLGTLAFVKTRSQFYEWVRRCLVSVVIFAILVTPFGYVYLTSFPSLDTTPADGVQDILTIYKAYGDLGQALESMIWVPCCNVVVGHGWHWVIWIGGLVGLIVAPFVYPERRRLFGFFLLFVLGVLLTSIGITALDQWINYQLGKAPTQVDLIRNVRFLVPILMLGYGVLFQMAVMRLRTALAGERSLRLVVPGMQLVFVVHVVAFMIPQFHATAPGYLTPSFDSGKRMTAIFTPAGMQPLLKHLQDEPPHTRVFPIANDILSLAIRYQSLQPVTYVYKDRNALLYSNHDDTRRFLTIHENYDAFLETEDLGVARTSLCRALELAPSDRLVVDHRLVNRDKLVLARELGTLVEVFEGVSVIDVQTNRCLALATAS